MLSLSKKGFDTENGRGASPILQDERMVPLPIPEPREGVRAATYGEMRHDNRSYVELLTELGYRVHEDEPAHLDPDLIGEVRDRAPTWRGMLGQVDQAESHLQNQGLGPGSIFMFWGWFEFETVNGRFHNSEGFSSLFGYLEVDHMIDVSRDPIPHYAPYHPHFAKGYPRHNNRVYVAREKLSWNEAKPGWGVFTYDPRLRLSAVGEKRRRWKLPGCFHPDTGCELTYNKKRDHWGEPGTHTTVVVPARGQEYVCQLTGGIADWVREVIDRTAIWTPQLA